MSTINRGGIFPAPLDESADIPPAIAGLLNQHGIDRLPGWRLTVQDLDRHFNQRGTPTMQRMQVKSALAQLGRIG